MRLPFGIEITRAKAAPSALAGATSVSDRGWFRVLESFPGAWQRNVTSQRSENVVTYFAVYACVTRIASDIAKLRPRLVSLDSDGIWTEIESAAFSPVLRKPNHYQNRIKFIEHWLTSKLIQGNAYILKERDSRGVVVGLYVLDPLRTKPLVTPSGDVYYQLNADYLSGVAEQTVVPAREIIHDVMVPLFHPLCGVSPLTASGLSALQGLSIQENSTKFFLNGAQPSGILTAPGTISDTDAERFKKEWEEKYTGKNAGRVAVLGGGLKYEAISVKAIDAQLIDQLKWSAKNVCSTYHVPAYMAGVEDPPSYNNIGALNQQYYTQCLQSHVECIELLLDEGLGIGVGVKVDGGIYGVEFDLDDLLRMDMATQVDALSKAVTGGLMTPNAAGKKLNQPPVPGGNARYLQQQNFSLEALAKRDAQADPFGTSKPAAAPAANDNALAAEAAAALDFIRKEFA